MSIHIYQIGLGFNQLNGEIPPELGTMESLEVLGLDGNQLEGNIPAEVTQMLNGKLQNVYFCDNRLSGELQVQSLLSLSVLFSYNIFSPLIHPTGDLPSLVTRCKQSLSLYLLFSYKTPHHWFITASLITPSLITASLLSSLLYTQLNLGDYAHFAAWSPSQLDRYMETNVLRGNNFTVALPPN